MTHWIDVEKELPKKEGRYLACYGSVFIANYTKPNKWQKDISKSGSPTEQTITHWMHLPEPPKI